MYGELEINNYHLLKYSLLFDFFYYFSSIDIYGLPIAQCLAGQFLTHIQQFVDRNRLNQHLLRKLMNEQKFQTMGDINEKLISFENITPVTIQKNNRAILLSDVYYPFAKEQLTEYEVTLYGVSHKESHSISQPHKEYLFREELKKINNNVVNIQKTILKEEMEHTIKKLPNHYYFKTKIFEEWLLKSSMNIINWLFILDQLLLKVRPSVIIDPAEASVYATILGLLSKKYQIPFINMPIYTIGDRNLIPSRADYYFVWGKNQKNWLINRKIKASNIFETGNIYFFYESKKMGISKAYFIKKLNIPSDHWIIGFTSQPFPDTNDKIEEWINAIPDNLPVTILVKKHRNDQYGYSRLNKKKNVKILSDDIPLYDFLTHINYLMTISSTTAFEAAIKGKPLLILQPKIPYHYQLNHSESNAYLAKNNAGEIIYNAQDLRQAVQRISFDLQYTSELTEKSKKFLDDSLLPITNVPVIVKSSIEEILKKHN
ncbi:capsular polysaccharide export protein, LipB/KpsS family [Cytobacillus firmus]|uniref:capsular polysaccharide export protein, LipB/KpsS family n=1 Tax=Bacillus sp. 22-7 TaxID=2709707 RepID=UPI0013D35B79|nr:hypothetical protein [Bacillus sp. 22-7]